MRKNNILKITVMKIFSELVCKWTTVVIYRLLRQMSKENKMLYWLARKK